MKRALLLRMMLGHPDHRRQVLSQKSVKDHEEIYSDINDEVFGFDRGVGVAASLLLLMVLEY